MSAMKRKWENKQEKNQIQEVYTDLERGPYQESKKSKITRVNRLFNLFHELSTTEQSRFKDLIDKSIV